MTKSTAKPEDDGDWLGYGVYADTLWARIVRALAKDLIDGELGDDPMVIGIFGEWGAGKSQLLKLIERRAKANLREQKKKREGDSGFELTVPVWFQPWKYEHEEHLHVPMVIHVLNALKDALKHEATLVDTVVNTSVAVADRGKKAAPLVQKTLEVANNAYPVIQKILKSITVFGCNVDLPDEVGEWLETAADGVSDIDLKSETKVKISTADAAVKHSTDGSYFYRIHELLGALTRPHDYKHRKDLFKDAKLTLNTRINFVVFIDDLDRCLPEKAVQTLELIKTMFNVESFAFVLALDDEVIERGIAHRYKDYALVDKKQQMPITGFEYLEKIIHLPFRLPALTIDQAEDFVCRYEEKVETDPALQWFHKIETQNLSRDGNAARDSKLLHDGSSMHDGTLRYGLRSDLLALALVGFDAYVPRKLIRLVELVHQIATIAREGQKTPISFEPHLSRDARVVLSLVLIQLFQPDLFRLMRRKEQSFGALLAAFAGELSTFEDADVANMDLWRWAIRNERGGQKSEWSPTSLDNIPTYVIAEIAKTYRDAPNERNKAQHVRFPLVSQLVEHRAAQRHVFDVLKLMKALADTMPVTGSLPHADKFQVRDYFSLLANKEVVAINAPLVAANYTTFTILNPQALAADLIGEDLSQQANLASVHELRIGQKLDSQSFAPVLNALSLADAENKLNKTNLLNGLQYLAPYLLPEDGKAVWALVEASTELETDITAKTDPKLRAQWNDLRAALEQDNRFEGKYALPKRTDGDAPEAPAGFVLCPIPESGEYIFDDGDEMRPQKRPYYISRFAVTVAQYATFVTADGYKDQTLWEASHKDAWLWRTGEFDSSKTIEDKVFKDWLARRPADLRHQPMNWAEQLANLNRPVTGVTWFEATAYAAWLEAQRQKGEGGVDWWGTLKDPQYRLRLPTEGEWERAARAGGTGKFPWGDDEADIDQRANVDRKVGHATTVGSYLPNALGLYDMAGNVWQWQANLYTAPYENKLITKETELHIGKDWQSSDCPSLRGGSWAPLPGLARCSSRSWFHPGYWNDGVGFRLVLSLADFES